MTDLSIIIVNYKNPRLLRLCLRTLARALPRKLATEVIVVDSCSTPETRNIVNHVAAGWFTRVKLVVREGNTGYTRGVNDGIRAASGRYILNLNPDTVPTSGAVGALVAFMDAHPGVGMTGPRLLNMDGSRQASCFRFYTPYTMIARRLPWLPGARRRLEHFLMSRVDLDAPCDVDWLMGSAFIARRSAVDDVGLLDERFFHYCSDDDWARRFWRVGWRVVYLPSAQVFHWHARHSKGRLGILDLVIRPQGRWHLADAWRYFRKHGLATARPTAA